MTITETMLTITDVDRDAMARAITAACARSEERRNQIIGFLEARPRELVADFAAGCEQRRNLGLTPWEDPPTYIWPEDIEAIIARGPVDNREYTGACVLKKLLAAGLSQYEPNPTVALKRASAA